MSQLVFCYNFQLRLLVSFQLIISQQTFMYWLVTEQAKKTYRFHVDPDLRRHVALQNHKGLIVFQ